MPRLTSDIEFSSDVSEELAELSNTARLVAREISNAFDDVGDSIATNLGEAVAKGQLDLRNLKTAILKDVGEILGELAKASLDQIILQPILRGISGRSNGPAGGAEQTGSGNVFQNISSSLGGAFGPFNSSRSGCCCCAKPSILGGAAGTFGIASRAHGFFGQTPLSVNVNLGTGVSAGLIEASEFQISSALARAVGNGLRGI